MRDTRYYWENKKLIAISELKNGGALNFTIEHDKCSIKESNLTFKEECDMMEVFSVPRITKEEFEKEFKAIQLIESVNEIIESN